jgi:hypothetical protein
MSREKAPHKLRKSGRTAPQKDMGVLCEVPDYVKLNSPISCPPLYFLHLFSNLLHIIGVPWQANSTIVRHWVSAMEVAF